MSVCPAERTLIYFSDCEIIGFGNGFCQYVIDSFVIWCEICPRLRIQLYLLIGLARSQQTNENIISALTLGRREEGVTSHLMALNNVESDGKEGLSSSVYSARLPTC